MRLAIIVLVFWLGVAALADVVSGDPNAVDKHASPFSPPNAHHILGTDAARRDVYARLIHGTREVVFVGGLAVTILLVAGLAAG
ncbi:MAG: ABC transporter permease, partial [Clostridia bacterium]|nr:ABC transporter permease [Deltaproteobacteria bacterium]